jgi:hypothetical protein
VLNYSRILARKERIVGTDRHGERLYVRFYDFLGDLVRFNILAIDLSTLRSSPLRRHSYGASATATEDGSVEPPAHALHSTTLRPYTRDALAAALERQGFADVQASGDLKLGRFDRAASDMLVILAGAPS